MKISENTLSVLKNFSAINPGISVKPGSTLSTVSPQKTILAEAKIEESFDKAFAIYDLSSMLGVFSLDSETPDIELEDKFLKIVSYGKRSVAKYFYAEPTMIVSPPDKKLSLPSTDINIKLSAKDLAYSLKNASLLNTPHVAFESDGLKVHLSAFDILNPTSNSHRLEIKDGDGTEYRMVYKKEYLDLLMSKDYDITISSKFISKFVSEDKTLTYWIAVEKEGSKYNG